MRGFYGMMLAAVVLVGCQATPVLPTQDLVMQGQKVIATPGQVRYQTLSPDRKRVAFVAGEPLATGLFVADVGGEPRRVGDVPAGIDPPRWQGDGTALLYTERLFKVVPGQYSDWDVPQTETLGYRLMRMPLGGSPHVLAESAGRITFQPSPISDQVVYIPSDAQDRPGALMRVSGSSPRSKVLAEGDTYSQLAWSPDGSRLAFVASKSFGKPALKVMDLASGTARTIEVVGEAPQVFWGSGNRLNVLTPVEVRATMAGVTVMTYSLDVAEVLRTNINLNGASGGKGFAYAGFQPSPDGTRLLSYRKAPHEIVVISISDQSVEVVGPVVGVVDWLDDSSFLYSGMVGNQSDLYKADVPASLRVVACPGREAAAIPPSPSEVPVRESRYTTVSPDFSYEVMPAAGVSSIPGIEVYELNGHRAKMVANQAVVTLSGPERLDEVLTKYGLALDQHFRAPTGLFPEPTGDKIDGTARPAPDCPTRFIPQQTYLFHVPTTTNDDISDLQALAREARLQGRHRFYTHTGAALLAKILRMRKDVESGIMWATPNGVVDQHTVP